AAFVVSTSAQTPVTAPKNKYSPADDVKLGQEAAQQVAQELPVMRDEQINSYLNAIGRRLAESIPAEFRHPEFRYTFTGVNLKEINAFALPGGPMFIQRGMIEKAHNEGEVAGVMAHELSHVALRHGTAQQTRSTPFAIGQMAGQIAGAIIGGTKGAIIAQGSQFGLGTYFMKFSREYERQADILGSRIMAGAGYDPRDMANVFKTIEKESGPGGPQWMSDHPNPGNRYDYINKEAQALRVPANPRRVTPEFQNAQAHLRSLPPAPSSEEVARNKGAGRTPGGNGAPSAPPSTGSIQRPDSRTTTYTEGNLFRVSVPANWQELASNNTVTFAPEGAYGTINGSSVFTHGTEIGVSRNEGHDLQTATNELLQGLKQGNPRLGNPGNYERGSLGGRQAVHTVLSNVSDATGGQEVVDVYTALLSDGSLFYVIGVAPRDEYNVYANVFRNVVRSIQLNK
ncbi:MAG: M48 family metallopeptidase, partial [Vicinamibacterales bacterium]